MCILLYYIVVGIVFVWRLRTYYYKRIASCLYFNSSRDVLKKLQVADDETIVKLPRSYIIIIYCYHNILSSSHSLLCRLLYIYTAILLLLL